MQIQTFIIDAFTNEPFKGNPAGVCLLTEPLDAATMQLIASEINLSETAFLLQDKKDETNYAIRYFTPAVEIAFCGHATLGSSKLILDKLGKEKVQFTTHHNLVLSATKAGKEISMQFPLYKTSAYNPGEAFYNAIGISNPVYAGFAKELDMLIVEVKDNDALDKINPDYAGLLKASNEVKELVVTSKSHDNKYDFYSRCFCPWIGINEDPVTGAAHAVLARYWGDILGKTEMRAYQSSKRGGFMNLRIKSETELEVISEAVIVFEGIFNVSKNK